MRRSHDKKHHDSALKVFPGSHSDTVPPDSIPNSEVKRISADGSVGFPHVRVGHCQVPLRRTRLTAGFLLYIEAIAFYVCELTEFSEVDRASALRSKRYCKPVFPGSHSDTVPPETISNSEVKRISANGSVGFPHVRVGHCQVPLKENRLTAVFLLLEETK